MSCKKPCQTCPPAPVIPVPTGTGSKDAADIIYKPNGGTSQLLCTQLGTGVTLEHVLETIDQKLCANTLPNASELVQNCVTNPAPPGGFRGLLNVISAKLCELERITNLNYLIGQLLSSLLFLNGLALNAAFISRLINNLDFINQLANSVAFISALTQNRSFISQLISQLLTNSDFIQQLLANQTFLNSLLTQIKNSLLNDPTFITNLGNKLVNDSTFVQNLVNAIINNPSLKLQFCCTEEANPCAGMVVNGVTMSTCNCQPPTNLTLSGPISQTINTDTTYQLSYVGTVGAVTWSVSGPATLSNQSSLSVTVTTTAPGSVVLTAHVAGCDGQEKTQNKTITVIPVNCQPAVITAITGPLDVETSSVCRYDAIVQGSTPLGYNWEVQNGRVLTDPTGTYVTVEWDIIVTQGKVFLTLTGCNGSTQTQHVDVTLTPANNNILQVFAGPILFTPL